jgi:hypothetical protein
MNDQSDDSLPEWTQEELALLRSADRDRPTSRSLPAALAALGVGSAIASSAAGAQSAAAATAGFATAAAKWSGVVAISKWVAVVAIGGAVVASGVVYLQPSAAVKKPATAPKSVAAPQVAAPASASPPEASRPTVVKPAAANSRASKKPPVSQPDIRSEIATLDAARTSLRAGDATETLATLDRYDRTFAKTGSLRLEATALRIEALVRTGDRPKAVALARAFLSRHPTSPYAARVRALTDTASSAATKP